MSQEEDHVQILIDKYNERLREITSIRDELRDKIILLDELKMEKIQELEQDGTPKKDPKTGAPIIKSQLPKHKYTGERMTKEEHKQVCDLICGSADKCIEKISKVKKS